MTDTHDKIRALFLSALMVFSVFAGTVAFAGTAAAADDTIFVDADDGDDSDGNGSESSPFASISTALNNVDQSGTDEIVLLDPGSSSYGSFSVSTAYNDLTIRTGDGVGQVEVSTDSGELADINADATITFQNVTLSASAGSDVVAAGNDAPTLTVTESTINVESDGSLARGILTRGQTTVDNTSIVGEGSDPTGGDSDVNTIGVRLIKGDSTTGTEVRNSSFDSLTTGARLVNGDNFVVDGNQFNNIQKDGVRLAIVNSNNVDTVDVTDNTFEGTGSGVAFDTQTGNNGDFTGEIDVTGNNFVGADDDGVAVDVFDSDSGTTGEDSSGDTFEGSPTLDFSGNFYGSQSGPSNVANGNDNGDTVDIGVGESTYLPYVGNEQPDSTGPSVESAIEFNDKIEVAFSEGVPNTNLTVGDDAGLADNDGSLQVFVNGENVTSSISIDSGDANEGRVVLSGSGLSNVNPTDDVIVQIDDIEDAEGNVNQPGNVSVTVTSTDVQADDDDSEDSNNNPATATPFSGSTVAIVFDGGDIGDNSDDPGSPNDPLDGTTITKDGNFERFVGGNFDFSGSFGVNSRVVVFDTADASTNQTISFNISGTPVAELDLRQLGLNAELGATSTDTADNVDVDIDANSGNREVVVEVFEEGADFDDDDPVADGIVGDSTKTLNSDAVATATVNTSATGTGNFTVLVTDAGTGAEVSTDTLNVSAAPEGSVEFADSTITQQRGDIVEIPINVTGINTAGVKIGSESVGFLINGSVTDNNDDDQVTLRVNTVNYNIVAVGDDDASLTLQETPDNVLAATNYNLRVLASEEDTPDEADNPGDVQTGSLVIEERTTDNFRTHVVPGAQFGSLDLNDDDDVNVEDIQTGIEDGVITQRNQIADGDVLVHQVVASGLDGFINPDTADVGADVTDAFFGNVTLNPANPSQEGSEIILTVEQDSANANQDAQQLTLDADNTQVIAGEDQYFLLTDTEELSNLQTGEQIEATLFLNADGDNDGASDNPENVTDINSVNFERFFTEAQVSTTASPEEPEIEFTTTNATVSENGTITGETNIAPGSEVRVVASADSEVSPSFVKSETIVVQGDGTFNVSLDFTENSAGDTYDLEVEDLGSGAPAVSASTTGTLEGAQTTPTQTVTATATDTAANETETAANETETVTETVTETETETATETETETATETETETETETATETETETEAPDTETETETETGTSTPGFTAVLGVVALLGAALLALRRQN